MKRFVKTLILCLLLCAVTISLFACGDDFIVAKDFQSTSGTAKEGGFIAETEKFYYVINGIGDAKSNNEFGKAVGKGSLIAVQKDDLSKSAVVVPKLFVGADYNAGIFIFDGRVYFATSSTDKELSGAVKSGNIVFASCKLDGTEYVEYITTSSLSTEYRFIALENNTVVVIYYDETNKAIVEYNTNSKTPKTIIKTDATADESLSAYKFFDNANLEKGVVAYTVDIYTKKEIEGSRGNAEKYNKMYIYKAGAENATLYKDGSNATLQDEKYTIKSIVNGEVVYTVTTINDTKGVTYLNNEIIDSAKFDVPYLFVGETFYTLNKDKTEITKKSGESEIETFAKVSDVTTLLFVNGDFVYYINAENKIVRVTKETDDVKYEDNKGEVVTNNTVATTWYKPQVINNILFYCDSSANGGSNIKYVDLTKELKSAFLVENKVADLSERIDNVSSFLKNERIEDVEKLKEELNAIDTAYNQLSKDEKLVVNDKYNGLNVYKDAVELSNLCTNKLKDINEKLTDKDKAEYQSNYDEVRAEFTKLEGKGQDYLNAVCNMMEQNSYYWFYYAKTNIFEKA